ncbi:MAG: nucleotidyltransferase [Phycisphaerae bacterium]|nr:nucleotidyltransferase [Phycisphaerae bacterium]
MAKPQLVVMAAGIGSRYGGLKQIDPVGPSGEIIIDYSIYDARRAGFDKVIFIIRKDIEDVFRRKVGRAIEKQIDTAYVFQELDHLPAGFENRLPADRVKPWGTGHALLCAAAAVSAPCAVINADDFYGAGSFQSLAKRLRGARDAAGRYDYCMVGFVLGNTLTDHGHVARGVCRVNSNGELVNVVERTRIEKDGPGARFSEDGGDTFTPIDPASVVSMNMWGFTPSIMAELNERFPKFLEANMNNPKAEFFIPTVVNELLAEKKAVVRVLPTDEAWLGVTYQEDRPAVQDAVRRKVRDGIYPENLWNT